MKLFLCWISWNGHHITWDIWNHNFKKGSSGKVWLKSECIRKFLLWYKLFPQKGGHSWRKKFFRMEKARDSLYAREKVCTERMEQYRSHLPLDFQHLKWEEGRTEKEQEEEKEREGRKKQRCTDLWSLPGKTEDAVDVRHIFVGLPLLEFVTFFGSPTSTLSRIIKLLTEILKTLLPWLSTFSISFSLFFTSPIDFFKI